MGTPDLRGDGEYIMRISRFIPDFITQTGDTQVSFTTRLIQTVHRLTTEFTIDSLLLIRVLELEQDLLH